MLIKENNYTKFYKSKFKNRYSSSWMIEDYKDKTNKGFFMKGYNY